MKLPRNPYFLAQEIISDMNSVSELLQTGQILIFL